jgi:iron(III) transport system permease protein
VAQSGIGPLLWNTAVYVSGTIAVSLFFAALWAWITERTDFRFKVTVRILMLLTMSLPALVQGFGWILLLNPSNGYVNHLLRELFGLASTSGPINIYSLGMMVAVSSFILTPTVYVMLSGAVKNLDYMLEFPAVLAGVPSRTVLVRIVAPVLLPALLSVLIFTVMIMLQVFDIPLSIGLTAGIHVLSTRIYLLSTAELGTPNYNLAAAFGVLLVLVAVLLVALYLRLTRAAEKFSVVSGKNFRYSPLRLGRRRYLVYALAAAYFLVSFSPVLILLWTSFQPFYSLPSLATLKNASLQNYAGLFGSSMFRRSVWNTGIVIVVGATVTMAISLVVAYATVRPLRLWSKLINIVAFIPIAVPHIVLGLAVLLLYVRTPLYGTIAAIILAQVSINMVFGTRMLSGALIQVHRDLERAGEVCGVPRHTVMTRILMPIIRSQMFNGWLLVFAHSMRDLGVPLVFLTSETVLLSSVLWLTWGYPNVPGAAALSVVMVVILALVVTPLQLYISRLDAKLT